MSQSAYQASELQSQLAPMTFTEIKEYQETILSHRNECLNRYNELYKSGSLTEFQIKTLETERKHYQNLSAILQTIDLEMIKRM